jgi:hypothetical protein
MSKCSYNKNIMVGILIAEKALLKSPYVKRYMPKRIFSWLPKSGVQSG